MGCPLVFRSCQWVPSVLHYIHGVFFYSIGFLLVFFLYYIFKRQYLLYCEFAVEDA